jgi:hypothetical protein
MYGLAEEVLQFFRARIIAKKATCVKRDLTGNPGGAS